MAKNKNKKKEVVKVVVSQPQKKKNRNKKAKSKTRMNPAMAVNAAVRGGNTRRRETNNMMFSMCNPWSAQAEGCKYPDGMTSHSIALQNRVVSTMGTLAAASAGAAFYGPKFPYNLLGVTGAATGTPALYTWASAYGQLETSSPLYTLVVTNGALYRPVCGGIVLRCLQNAMTAAGYVIITKVPSCPVVSTTWQSGQVFGDSQVYPITAGLQIPIFFKPVGTNAYSYNGQNTVNSTDCNWDGVVIEILGASGVSTTVFSVDWIVNYEVEMSSKGYSYSAFSTPAPPANPKVQSVVSKVLQTTPSIQQGDPQTIGEKMIDKAIDYAIHLGETFLADMFMAA